MIDVLHHLAKPKLFFGEARRILEPGGRLIMIEPAVTPARPVAVRQTGCRFLQSLGHCGTMDQGMQERHQIDSAVMLEVPQQRGAAPESCPSQQSRQLHADIGLARRSVALVTDHAAGEDGQD